MTVSCSCIFPCYSCKFFIQVHVQFHANVIQSSQSSISCYNLLLPHIFFIPQTSVRSTVASKNGFKTLTWGFHQLPILFPQKCLVIVIGLNVIWIIYFGKSSKYVLECTKAYCHMKRGSTLADPVYLILPLQNYMTSFK